MRKRYLEKNIIYYGAPTLAGIKTGNLFTVRNVNIEIIKKEIDFWNKFFMSKEISIKLLRNTNNCALIYIYRKNMLNNDLSNPLAKKILKENGYLECSIDNAIEKLINRLKEYDDFPHEIGLFLGYPPKDVEGFICNKGKNCNLCGYWKVYGDTETALIQFSRFDKCKEIYKRLWEEGKTINKLAVA